MSCSVKHCRNVRRFYPEGITFHAFPKEDDLVKKWIEALGRGDDWKLTPKRIICSHHFRKEDFEPFKLHARLKKGAVPSLYLTETKGLPNYQGVMEPTPLQTVEHFFSDDIGDFIPKIEKDTGTIGTLPSSALIQSMHTYSLSLQPLERKYKKLKQSYGKKQIKWREAQRTIMKLKTQVSTLQNIIKELRKTKRPK